MDDLKAQVKQKYQDQTFSLEDVELLQAWCKELIAPEKKKIKDKEEESEISEAWDCFVSDSNLDKTIPLVLYIDMMHGRSVANGPTETTVDPVLLRKYDSRSWTGYYIKDDYHAVVSTTPYLAEKNIYFEGLEGNQIFPHHCEVDKEDCRKIIKKLASLKPSELFKYSECPKCDDQCKCQSLNKSGDEEDEFFNSEVFNGNIKPRTDIFPQIEEDVICLMKYYILVQDCSGAIYKEDDYFGILE